MKFIPSLTGNPPPNDADRDLFALPARLGGVGLCNPVSMADSEHSSSSLISELPVRLILVQYAEYTHECQADQIAAKSTVRHLRRQLAAQSAEEVKPTLSNSRRRAMELASEMGASNWLTSLPIEEFGFCLHKGAFTDALALMVSFTNPHVL